VERSIFSRTILPLAENRLPRVSVLRISAVARALTAKKPLAARVNSCPDTSCLSDQFYVKSSRLLFAGFFAVTGGNESLVVAIHNEFCASDGCASSREKSLAPLPIRSRRKSRRCGKDRQCSDSIKINSFHRPSATEITISLRRLVAATHRAYSPHCRLQGSWNLIDR